MDLYYYESGYIEDGYFTYVANAESSFELTCSVSAIIGVIKGTDAQLTSTFTQTCDVDLGNLVSGEMFAYMTALMAIEVSLIKDNNTQVSSVFNIAIEGMRVRYVSAQCDADAAISFDYTRVREDEAAFDAVFSSIITANKVIEFSASLTDAFAPTITCNPLRNLFAQLDLTTSLSATPDYTKGAIGNLQSNFTLSSVAKVSKEYNANLTSIAAIYAYGTFNNKRPRSITRVGNEVIYNPSYPSGIGQWADLGLFSGTGSDSLVPYGTNRYYRIENKSKTPILANQSFYISMYVNFYTSNQGSILNADAWEIGSGLDTIYFRFNSSTVTVNVVSTYNATFKIEVYRISSTITLKVTNNSTNAVYTGTLTSTASATPTNDYIKLSSVSTPIIVDELFFTIGESQVYQYRPNGEIGDGWRTTTQFMYHFNNNFIDDMSGGVYNVPAVLVSQATIIANAGKSAIANANLNSNATLVCTPQFMPLEFDANLSSEFSQNTIPNKLIDFVSYLDSSFNITIDNQRIRETTSAFDSIAVELVAIGYIGNFFINCEVNSNITVDAVKTTDQLINLESTASISETLVRIRNLDSTISTNATVDATLTKVIEFNAQLSSQTLMTATYTKVIAFTSQQSISAELYASNGNIVVIQSQMNTNASLITTVNPIRETNAILNQTATLVCNPRRIRTIVSIQSSQSTFTNQLVRIRKTTVSMDAFVTQLTAIAKKVNEVSSMNVEATLSVTATVIVGKIQAILNSNFGLEITEERIRTNSSNPQSTFISTISISKSVGTNAVMISQTSMIAIGIRFYLDPDLTFIIPKESREWIIASEDRSIIIENEDRTFIIGK